MKPLLHIILALSLEQSFGQSPTPPAVGDKIEKITLLNGETYSDVTIRKILPEGISIVHSAGAKTLLAPDLPPELKEAFTFLTEEEISARKAREEKAAAAANQPRKVPPAAPEATRYITSQQMKVHWLNKLPVPSALSPTYSQDMKARQQFVADVKAGKYEARAAQAAASYNRDVAVKAGDFERARLFGEDLARADANVASEDAALVAREASSELRGRLEAIRVGLGRIHGQMVIDASNR